MARCSRNRPLSYSLLAIRYAPFTRVMGIRREL
jgi:hypothetical protein